MIIFIVVAIIFLLLLGIIIIFTFPQFSPIPYFPSNKKDLSIILKALEVQKDQTIIDFGAGDGVVIFAAATQAFKKKLNTQFIALDINPILTLIMQLRRIVHPNRKNIKVMRANMFTLDIQRLLTYDLRLLTCFFYISPRFLEPMIKKLEKVRGRKTVVSYFYPIDRLKKSEISTKGIHAVYKYKLK
jgi:16S rRNA A1518/A1519 N6-dimethyltransferase RsmA/KsgA/DIM1 with predicted DNA glycosylase/AP lyase activity